MNETLRIIPKHIAVIMDGNGRWATRQGKPRFEGHRQGALTARQITEDCSELGVEHLTLYCLSSENWKRPEEELAFLMQLLRHYMIEERTTMMKNNIRLKIIGRRERIPDSALEEMDKTVKLTAANTGMTLHLAINYGSRAEIVGAVRRIVDNVLQQKLSPEKIDETLFSNYLDTSGTPDPDLLIRTSGELRLSNYLLWQLSYAEIWVASAYWPDFNRDLLLEAIDVFSKRQRRFGGVEIL
ncbi:MAG: isoprenyl transferase [Planctomycetaceae bacterium]|jgi:undecaprenyl diphosphate synthase|nr:isoprenyl transferase [Planctomycetaceae bacterium]